MSVIEAAPAILESISGASEGSSAFETAGSGSGSYGTPQLPPPPAPPSNNFQTLSNASIRSPSTISHNSTEKASQKHGDQTVSERGANQVNSSGLSDLPPLKSDQPSLQPGNPPFSGQLSGIMAKSPDPITASIGAGADVTEAGLQAASNMYNSAQQTKQTAIRAQATQKVGQYNAQAATASAAYANQGGVSDTSNALNNKLELGNLFNQTANVFSGNEFNSILGAYFQNKTGGLNVNI